MPPGSKIVDGQRDSEPFSVPVGALLFHLLSMLYERTSVIITTKLSFSEWASVFADAKLSPALLDRLRVLCRTARPNSRTRTRALQWRRM